MKERYKYRYLKVNKHYEYKYFRIKKPHEYGYFIIKKFDRDMKDRYGFHILVFIPNFYRIKAGYLYAQGTFYLHKGVIS